MKLYTGRIRIRVAFLGAGTRDDVPGKVAVGGDIGVEDAVGAEAGRAIPSEEGTMVGEGCTPGSADTLSGEGTGTVAGPESPSADDPTSRRRRLALTLRGTPSDSSSDAAARATSCVCPRNDVCEAVSLSLPEGSSPSEPLETPAASASSPPSGELCPAGKSSG